MIIFYLKPFLVYTEQNGHIDMMCRDRYRWGFFLSVCYLAGRCFSVCVSSIFGLSKIKNVFVWYDFIKPVLIRTVCYDAYTIV